MFHSHVLPGPGQLLLIHTMWVFGALVCSFGIYCIYKGINKAIRRSK